MINKLLQTMLLLCLPFIARAQDTLSLQEALALSLQHNHGIRLAKLDESLAVQQNSYGNAGFLPRIDAGFTQTYNHNNTYQRLFSGDVREGDGAKSNTLNASVQLDWTLFDGLAMFLEKDKLETLQQLGETKARGAIANTLAAVQQQYAALVRQQQLIRVIREAITLSRERMQFRQTALSIGAASELSFLQSKVDMNADSSRWLTQNNQLEKMKSDLNVMLGRNPATPFNAENTIHIQPDLDFARLEQQLKSNNPEIQSIILEEQIASLQQKQANAAYLPKISVFSGYSYGRSEYEIGILSYNRNSGFNYGLTASLNLFSGFSRDLARKKARIAVDQARVALEEIHLQLGAYLYNTFSDYRTQVVLVQLEMENVEVARRNLFIASENYRNGGISDLDLRSTQLKLIEAEGRLIDARFLAKSAEIELGRLAAH